MISNASVRFIVTKQGKRFVAYAPALDIATSGKSEKEAKERFAELTDIFFEELCEAGTAREVLLELGWTRQQKRWTPPRVVSTVSMGLRIPAFA